MAIRDAFLPEFGHEMATTRKLLVRELANQASTKASVATNKKRLAG
jgi:hypothetical protein